MPAFNVAPFLGEAVQSVLNQTHAEWSLIVVDDGSTDDIDAAMAGFADPRIRLVRQAHQGVSAARNRGIWQAGSAMTDAYLFLDGDDFLAADAVVRLVWALEAAPWAVAAHGRYARVGADGIPRVSAAPRDGSLLETLLVRNLFANGGHLLIRQEAVVAAGDFRGDLSYGEDWEYWTRLALLGEFVADRGREPLLFVRERAGSAMRLHAADPSVYRAATEAIYRNPAMAHRLGSARLAGLRQRAEAETAWAVGRELIRHGQRRAGQRWLGRSLAHAPSVRRLLLMLPASLRLGPFRPYPTMA